MPVFIGFVAGYLLGARAGKERYTELCEAWNTIRTSETVRSMVSGAPALVVTGVKAVLSGKLIPNRAELVANGTKAVLRLVS